MLREKLPSILRVGAAVSKLVEVVFAPADFGVTFNFCNLASNSFNFATPA
jgi:hypothetical protein